jgi:iron(III) transport system ATP-binding protein
MLQVERLGLQGPSAPILRQIDLTVAPGSIQSLLGPSGSGKTSLLRLVMGLAVPSEGSISFAGQVLSQSDVLRVAPELRPFSYLFQSFTLLPHLDVRRNILLGTHHLDRDERRSRLAQAADMLGIGDLLDRTVHDLSGGEQQRVALARTLIRRPRLLLLDEPFSNLDRMARWQLYADVKRAIRESGMSALLATHDQDEAYYFSDRMAVLSGGSLVANDAPAQLYREPGTAWLARFTGEANVLTTAELIQAVPAWRPPEDRQVDLWLVRPEQLVPTPVDGTDGVTVEEVIFLGRSTTLRLSVAGVRLTASVADGHGCRINGTVRLALAWPPAGLRP